MIKFLKTVQTYPILLWAPVSIQNLWLEQHNYKAILLNDMSISRYFSVFNRDL